MTELHPETDRCPGLSRPFLASDGGIVRVRRPGGRLHVEMLRHLLSISERWGDGRVQVTTRGNLQVRGLPLEPDGSVSTEIADAVRATGLVPATHELVRNVLCSPLPSRDRPNLQPMVTELDEELRDVPLLEDLPGRFLSALDNGSGDVAGEPWDLCYQAIDEDRGVVAVCGGGSWHISRTDAVSTMLALAEEFQLARAQADHPIWHPDELGFALGDGMTDPYAGELVVAGPPTVGAYGDDLLLGVPLGLFTAEMIRALPALADVTVTPWHQILIPGAAEQVDRYQQAGYVVDPADPWASITACTDLPNRATSATDTHAIAGQPADTEHLDLLAPTDLEAALRQLQAGDRA